MQQNIRRSLSRRSILATGVGFAGLGALPRKVAAQPAKAATAAPASVVSNPPRDWTPGHPSIYPDPDVIVVDPSFNLVRRAIAPIQRVWTGALWAEGPAWSSQGQYLVFSDVSGNTQYRYIWDDGRVTPFRKPSYNTNGNSFDYQGRQLSCEDFFRRVVRWEHDGTLTVIADNYQGKPLNSPNDLVPHPDGSIWFTDPPYGDSIPEGHPDEAGGPANPQGLLNPRIGAENAGAIGGRKRELPTNVYRWDPSGRLEVAIGELFFADRHFEPAARVPAVDIGRQFALAAADRPGIFGADAGVEKALRVGRTAGLVGMALGDRVAVRRVGKPDAAVRMGHQIIGRIERLALVIVGDHGQRAVMLPAHDAAKEILARELPALIIKAIAVGVVGWLAERRDPSVVPDVAILGIARDVAEHEVLTLA